MQAKIDVWQKLQFDKHHNVETTASVEVADLDIDDIQKSHAVEYEASYGIEVLQLIDGLPIDYRDFHFVDFGCGKGRVLLLASEFPFQAITGIEISRQLANVAERNLQQSSRHQRPCQNVTVCCGDAISANLPQNPLVLFFFNPFGEELMAKVIARIEHSYIQEPREIFLIYTNPVHKHLFESEEKWQSISLWSADTEKHRIYRMERNSDNQPSDRHRLSQRNIERVTI